MATPRLVLLSVLIGMSGVLHAADVIINDTGRLIVRSPEAVTVTGGDMTVNDGGTIELDSGTLNAGTLTINAGGSLIGCGTINANIVNQGAVSLACGPGVDFTIVGLVNNHGTWEITDGTNLDNSTTFTNESTGVLDISTAGTGPNNLVNFGTLIGGASATIFIDGIELVGNDVHVRLLSEVGKSYQLQRTTDLESGVWTPEGSVTTGTGGLLDLVHSGGTSGSPVRFYRIVEP